MPELDNLSDLDKLINAEVSLPNGERIEKGIVVSRVVDRNGNPVGNYDPNPIMDSRVYEVMFPDGTIHQYAANIIEESICNEVDDEGRRSQILDEIVDVESTPDVVQMSGGFVKTKNGRKKRRITTKGWNFLVKWKAGDESWIPLKDIKESYPVRVAEYAVHRGIDK